MIAEGSIEMQEQIAIPRPEDKTGAELEGIPSKRVLSITGSSRAIPGFAVVAAENVKKVS